ncbi:Serine/threonine-protein kinase, partial [Actinidia chinensis var. chinensis]
MYLILIDQFIMMFKILALGLFIIWLVYVALLRPSNEEGERRKKKGTSRQDTIKKVCVRTSPSFDRPGTSRERNNLQRGDIMTRQSVPGQNVVVVRPRTSNGTTVHLIAEEEAVCKRCSNNILNSENILMTKCGC